MRGTVLSILLLATSSVSFAQTTELGENQIRIEIPGVNTSACIREAWQGWDTESNPVARLERVLLARQHGFSWDIDDETLSKAVQAKRYTGLRGKLELPEDTPQHVVDEWLIFEPIAISERRRLGLSPRATDQEFREAYRADWNSREAKEKEMMRAFEAAHGVPYTSEASMAVKLGLPLDSSIEDINDAHCRSELRRYGAIFDVPDATTWQMVLLAAEQ